METELIQVEYIMANDPEHARLACAWSTNMAVLLSMAITARLDSAAVPILDVGFIHADAAYDVVGRSKGLHFSPG